MCVRVAELVCMGVCVCEHESEMVYVFVSPTKHSYVKILQLLQLSANVRQEFKGRKNH